jgi:hypothetical protein
MIGKGVIANAVDQVDVLKKTGLGIISIGWLKKAG